LEISPFVHFMVQILFHKSNGVQSVSSFKILNDVCSLYIVRSEIFNLDHEMETLHFISNGEDPCPVQELLFPPLQLLQNMLKQKEAKIGKQ
jgi:hypothetical protein